MNRLVRATLTAWSTCPSMVKKEMDMQYKEMHLLRARVEELEDQARTRRDDIMRREGEKMRREVTVAREKLENEMRVKLAEERRRLGNLKIDEMERLKQDNKELQSEVARLKLILKKGK